MDTIEGNPGNDELRTLALKLAALGVSVAYDGEGRPKLVLTDGPATVELVPAEAHIDTLTGLRELSTGIWDYQQQIVDMRLEEARTAADAPDATTTSEVRVDADASKAAARLAAMGPRVGNTLP